MITKYRKKPVVIEAVQFTGNNEIEIIKFVGKPLFVSKPPANMEKDIDIPHEAYVVEIPTLEGNMKCSRMDFVIKGVAGEFYPCKPDIFHATYEIAE